MKKPLASYRTLVDKDLVLLGILTPSNPSRADAKSRSTLGFNNLHHRGISGQSWRYYSLDPPGGSGKVCKTGSSVWRKRSRARTWSRSWQ